MGKNKKANFIKFEINKDEAIKANELLDDFEHHFEEIKKLIKKIRNYSFIFKTENYIEQKERR